MTKKNQIGYWATVFLFITLATTGIIAYAQKTEPKKYPVYQTVDGWQLNLSGLDYTKTLVMQSDLSAIQKKYVIDSILTPLQSTIALQVRTQLQAEQQAEQKKTDSLNKKKN